MSSLDYIEYLRKRSEVYNSSEELNYPSNSQIKTVVNPLRANYTCSKIVYHTNSNFGYIQLMTNIYISKYILERISKNWYTIIRNYYYIPADYNSSIMTYINKKCITSILHLLIIAYQEYITHKSNDGAHFENENIHAILSDTTEIGPILKTNTNDLIGHKRKHDDNLILKIHNNNNNMDIDIPLPYLCKQMKLSIDDNILMPIISKYTRSKEIHTDKYIEHSGK